MLTPQRPIGKRKRWIAAAVLWLVVAYPLSVGPLFYALHGDWIPARAVPIVSVYCLPMGLFVMAELPPGEFIRAYTEWFADLARGHNR